MRTYETVTRSVSGSARSWPIRTRCQRASIRDGLAAASSRPRASAGSDQSRTVTSRSPGQVAVTAQVAAPVPPPTSMCPAGVQSGTPAAKASRAAWTASKVAGMR
ncbi:hypothetical protein RKD19_005848 [Streptomyces canus]